MATREEVEQAMQGMTKEQKLKFLDALEKEYGSDSSVAGSAALGGVEGISETPKFQQPLRTPDLKNPYTGETVSGMDTVSPEFLTDILPGALGTLGGALGIAAGPAGAAAGGAAGSATGEFIRQRIRDLVEFAPGTGMTQELLDLDPRSPEAMAVGIIAEGLGGAAAEFAGARGLAKYPAKKEIAKKRYVNAIAPEKTIKEKDALLEAMRPELEKNIPVGTGGMIRRYAEKKLGPYGENVEKAITKHKSVPIDYQPVSRRLLDRAAQEVETPATTITEEALLDEPLVKALRKRSQRLESAEEARRAYGQRTGTTEEMTMMDAWKRRKNAAKEAKRASAEVFLPGREAKRTVAEAEAAMEEYGGLRDVMRSAYTDGDVARADDAYHAIATMLDTASDRERSHFLARLTARGAIPGRGGAVAGLAVSVPSLWRTSLAKSGDMIADALKAGDTAHARQIFRSMLDAMAQPETKPLEEEQ